MSLLDGLNRQRIKMSPEEVESIKRFERGTALAPMVEFAGWTVLQELIAEEIETAQRRLDSSTDEDTTKIYTLHVRIHAMKDLQRSLNYSVDSLVEAAHHPPELLERYNLT